MIDMVTPHHSFQMHSYRVQLKYNFEFSARKRIRAIVIPDR